MNIKDKIKNLIKLFIIVLILLGSTNVYAVDNNADTENVIETQEEIKHIWCFDTQIKNATFDKNEIHIEGWKIATEETKLNVYIDGNQIDESNIRYSYKYDLLSIVQGYGTRDKNARPNFDIDISTENLKQGTHKLKIEQVTENGTILDKIETNINIDKNIKHIWCFDTQIKNATFDKYGIHIEGWKIATEETKLKVYIDDVEIEENNVRYSYKYDLLSIIQGYGTRDKNTKPNFDIDIPTENLSQGTHKIKIEQVMEDETVLDEIEANINIDKSIKHIWCFDTQLQNETFDRSGIHIEGWKIATEETKLKVYVDDVEIEESNVRYSYKYDLLSIVKGYGTYEENAEPNFEIDIPVENLSDGTHKITFELVLEDGTVLNSDNKYINFNTPLFRIHVETIYDRTTLKMGTYSLSGWIMTNPENVNLKLLIDGQEQDNIFQRNERPDVIAYHNNLFANENKTPGFSTKINFANYSAGLHQIAIRAFGENGNFIGECVMYVFTEPVFEIHVETIYDRTTLKKGVHSLSGWLMTCPENATLKLLIDGQEQSNVFERYERPDVIAYYNNLYANENKTPGFGTKIDFTNYSLGLHQIAIRVFDVNGRFMGEHVMYIFVGPMVTVEQGTYGKSGLAVAGDPRGSNLIYYKIGEGPNVMFATFSVHGFEDLWAHDGSELTNIAESFKNKLYEIQDEDLYKKWTIYIFPTVNPDGQKYGTTNNGKGRTTLYSKLRKCRN